MKNLESNLQQGCVSWFNLQYPQYYGLLFAVPNGGKRNIITATIQKREGVISGVADLIFLVQKNGFNGLCIEMKYGNGKQSEKQKIWQEKVTQQGYAYVVCNSVESFMLTINNYINEKV